MTHNSQEQRECHATKGHTRMHQGQLGGRSAGGGCTVCVCVGRGQGAVQGMSKSFYSIFGRKKWASQGKQAKQVWHWLVGIIWAVHQGCPWLLDTWPWGHKGRVIVAWQGQRGLSPQQKSCPLGQGEGAKATRGPDRWSQAGTDLKGFCPGRPLGGSI